ncbi:hypothetical protein MKW92_044592 [Papaver armeniacum]|nr:hypothetical protein MKW92_044592 [Papaver armeniacum]
MWTMGDRWAMIMEHLFPDGFLHKLREQYITPHLNCLTKLYVKISIDEYPGDQLIDHKNQSYTFTEAY